MKEILKLWDEFEQEYREWHRKHTLEPNFEEVTIHEFILWLKLNTQN